MDLHLIILTIIIILYIVMSLVAVYRSNETVDKDIQYIEKIMEHIELEKRIKEKEKEINYEQAVKDILDTLPEGSVKVMDGPIDNTIVIRIRKDIFM